MPKLSLDYLRLITSVVRLPTKHKCRSQYHFPLSQLHAGYIPVTYYSQLKIPLFIGTFKRHSSIETCLQLHTSYIHYAQNGTYPLLFRLWFSVFSSLIFPAIKVSFMIRDAIG